MYLANYYKRYFSWYEKITIGNWITQSFRDDNISRSTDLPFIGSEVLKTGEGEFLFVFKGSLQKPEKFSMTVLSCLWMFENSSPYKYLLDQFWPDTQNYHPLVKNLGITPEIANKSFVTDFARVASRNGKRDAKKSKALY
jgi:hypothetical protein